MTVVRIKFFAFARDLAGCSETNVTLTERTRVSEILDLLSVSYPALHELGPYMRIAVNCEYVHGDYQLRENDEVALIPPVSGG